MKIYCEFFQKFYFTPTDMQLLGWPQIKETQELAVVSKNTKMNRQKCNFEILYCTVSIKSIFSMMSCSLLNGHFITLCTCAQNIFFLKAQIIF